MNILLTKLSDCEGYGIYHIKEGMHKVTTPVRIREALGMFLDLSLVSWQSLERAFKSGYIIIDGGKGAPRSKTTSPITVTSAGL